MDATLAFVTASFARVRPGDLVLDPFCGTGGNLIAACHMSQRAGIGADADARTLLRGTARCDGGSLKLDARLRKAQNMANVGGRRGQREREEYGNGRARREFREAPDHHEQDVDGVAAVRIDHSRGRAEKPCRKACWEQAP